LGGVGALFGGLSPLISVIIQFRGLAHQTLTTLPKMGKFSTKIRHMK